MRASPSAIARSATALAVLSACLVALILLATPRVEKAYLEEVEDEFEDPSDESDWNSDEQEYALSHPVYTRCSAKLDMPEFVKTIRKTCGDVHELSTINGPCKDMLQKKSAEVGCCWESVMQAYEALDPQAAHKWRLWQGTVSGKGGVTFDAEDCGESMGEKSYTDLKTEVGQLKDVVGEQQSEIGAIVNAFSSFYYGGGYSGAPSSPSYAADSPYNSDPDYDPYWGSYYYNYYDPLTGVYFKNGKPLSNSLKAAAAQKKGAPTPPFAEGMVALRQHAAQPQQPRPQLAQGLAEIAEIKEQQAAINAAIRDNAVREHYRAASIHDAATRNAIYSASEHSRAASIHDAAANAAIYAATVHAQNANAYAEQYYDLVDNKLPEVEGHAAASNSAARTAQAAAEYAGSAADEATKFSDSAKHAADVAETGLRALTGDAPLLPVSDTIPPTGGTAAFFTLKGEGDAGVKKLESQGVNVGF